MCGFYILWKRYQEDKKAYIPIWQFVGELHITELETWVMASHKCTARVSDIYLENPKLIDRVEVTGKSGAKYFQYRFSDNVSKSLIVDPTLRLFYDALKKGKREMELSNNNNLN